MGTDRTAKSTVKTRRPAHGKHGTAARSGSSYTLERVAGLKDLTVTVEVDTPAESAESDRALSLLRTIVTRAAGMPMRDLELVAPWFERWGSQARPGGPDAGRRTRIGPALSQADVARLLDKSPQAVHKDRRLLVLRQPDAKGTARPTYPVFQFRGHSIRPEVGETVRLLSGVAEPETIAAWLTSPLPELEGRTPLDALGRRSWREQASALARRFAASLA